MKSPRFCLEHGWEFVFQCNTFADFHHRIDSLSLNVLSYLSSTENCWVLGLRTVPHYLHSKYLQVFIIANKAVVTTNVEHNVIAEVNLIL